VQTKCVIVQIFILKLVLQKNVKTSKFSVLSWIINQILSFSNIKFYLYQKLNSISIKTQILFLFKIKFSIKLVLTRVYFTMVKNYTMVSHNSRPYMLSITIWQ